MDGWINGWMDGWTLGDLHLVKTEYRRIGDAFTCLTLITNDDMKRRTVGMSGGSAHIVYFTKRHLLKTEYRRIGDVCIYINLVTTDCMKQRTVGMSGEFYRRPPL